MSSPRVLHLTVKKKWFDKIISGEKTDEYRKYKPYWITRLMGKDFDVVQFRVGYSKNAPAAQFECKRIYVFIGPNDLNTIDPVFRIELGKMLWVQNYE